MPSPDPGSDPATGPAFGAAFGPEGGVGVRRGWLAAWAAAVLPFLLLSYYNYPSIHDDYVNANLVAQYGRLGYVRQLYATWTGRYTEALLKAYLNPLTYQQTAWLARWQPVVVIGLLLLGAYALFRQLLRGAPASVAAAGALLLTVLYLNGFPTAGASFYWFGGYTSYTAGAIASLFAFAGLVVGLYGGPHGGPRPAGAARAQSRGGWVVAAGFSLLAVGTYEVSMMALIVVVGSAALGAWLKKQPAKWPLSAVLLVLLLGACAAVAAPGNQARAASAGRSVSQLLSAAGLLRLGGQSGWLMFRQGVHWARSPLLLLGSGLLAGLLWRARTSLPLDLARVSPVGFGLWLLGGLSSLIFPSMLIYERVQEQTWQAVYFYFLLGWLSWVAVAYARYAPRLAWLAGLSRPVNWRGAALVFSLLCFYAGNTHLAWVELFTTAPAHYRRVRQRAQRLQEAAARRAPAVEMRPLYAGADAQEAPQILYTIDFNDNDAAQYARYYGVDSVLLKPSPARR